MARVKRYAVAASGQWTDEEEGRRRLPATGFAVTVAGNARCEG